jgi:serine/threonine protein kinase
MIFSRDHARTGDELRSKGQFEKAAESYRKAKKLELAAEMYREAKKTDLAVAAYKEAGLPLLAARLLVQAGFPKEATPLFREAGALPEGAEAIFAAGLFDQAALLFEQLGLFERAAECCVQLGDTPRALVNLEKAADGLRRRSDLSPSAIDHQLRELDLYRADLLERLGRAGEAARLLFARGMYSRAASLFEKDGDPGQAVKSFLDAGLVDEALDLVRRYPNLDPELRAEAFLNAGEHLEGAQLFEELGKLDAAASAYQTAGDWARAATLYEEIGSFGVAADLYYRVDRFYDAGRCFARSAGPDKGAAERHAADVRAAEAFVRAGAHQRAADAYMSAEMPLEAAELYQRAGRVESALEALGSIEPEDPMYLRAMATLVPILLDREQLEAAELPWQTVRDSRGSFKRHELAYLQGRFEEAHGHFDEAEKLYRQVISEKPDYRDAAERARDVAGRIATDLAELAQQHVSTHEDLTVASKLLRPGNPGVPTMHTPPAPPPPRPPTAHATQKIAFKPSPASTGTVGFRPPDRKEIKSEVKTVSGLSDLPVTIEGPPVEPWWAGAAFFRAFDTRKSRPVLLVSFPLAEIGDRVALFRQVMRQVGAIQHKAILKLEETVLASDKVLLLYEAFDGETLATAFDRGHHLSPTASLQLLMQLCEALTGAHKLGVTHQWLSPRTLLVDAEGKVKVAGIGLREFLASRGDSTSDAYLSPEVREDGVVGPSADVFSLGYLAMQLFMVSVPVNWEQQDPLDPSTFHWPAVAEDTLPPLVRETLVRCLSPDPLARPTIAEVAGALASFGFIPGQLLNDRFEIRAEIGRGGMSRVYRAYDQLAEEVVAIKTLLAPSGNSEEAERLRRELQICRKIVHPNVVRVYDIGRYPGGIFVHMEMLEGPGLDQVIKDESPLPPSRVRKLMIEIAAALAEAHRLHIVHRDLKPGNVILVGGRAKVLDFGIARMNDGTATNLTRTGEVIGSPMYMSPEQIQGLPLDGTCDLYALGVIAYTLLAGREPFTGDNTTAIVLKHLQEKPPEIRRFAKNLSDPWVALLAKLLAKKPQGRYKTADDLIGVLETLPDQ